MSEFKYAHANAARRKAAEARREAFLEQIKIDPAIDVACAALGVGRTTYQKWRQDWPEWAARIDVAKGTHPSKTARKWTGGFAEFRLRFFGMRTTWFQQLAVRAYEETPLGNITLILWPPEHGKTTLFEDFASYKLAVDPTFRFCVGSEKLGMSRKVLGRVKKRMEPDSPFKEYLKKWGPFFPQSGEPGATRQPWGADYFNVWKKGSHDERDYNMVALGMTSAIAGTRTDHLHVDDPQSLKSYQANPIDSSTKLLEIFRQDWLTRPGEHGRTTINGTRVGGSDFYEMVMEVFPPEILRVIKFPAITYYEERDAYAPLWEYDETDRSGYTPEMLDRLKIKVGADAWARNYMQNPLDAGDATFSDDVIAQAMNPLRSIKDGPDAHAPVIIMVDPGFGTNVVTAAQIGMKMRLLKIQEDLRFTRTEQIIGRIEDQILWIEGFRNGAHVTDVVIEEMAFQKGMLTDRQLLSLQQRWGFAIRGHLTNANKYDENIGVASMARDMRMGNIEIPYADDEITQPMMDQIVRQLKAWRPRKRGTELRQDQVMALWFGWILWRERRGTEETTDSSFSFKGMPWSPTRSGLLTPMGARR